jgi:CTP synthase
MTKHIFVTGGVVSSLGKGLTCAAIGMLLENRGFKIALQKLDPYINVDPGTMSPYQHGEVYVTEDGAETDLDLGHYERFTHAVLTRDCNYTTGKIYREVIRKERAGDYLGSTVQVVPHITDEIKDAICSLDEEETDLIISEIGGTVGDIESLPFLEAIRQFALEAGRENALFIHLTLLPYLRASQESKTKPTQHSVGKLREIGIQPDILICRTERGLTPEMRAKISLFCNVERRAVIDERDVEFTIYQVPLDLAAQQLDDQILEKLRLEPRAARDLGAWQAMVERMRNPRDRVTIAVVGKYIELHDAYKSIYESLTHGGIANDLKVELRKVQAESVLDKGARALLGDVDGVLIPGGFGERGIEGKIEAVRFARENGIPFFGICLGMQVAVIELCRHVLGLEGANTTEIDAATAHPVISLLAEQREISDMGGTMRLGAYACSLLPGTRSREAYGQDLVHERHRHRYEFNDRYRASLEAQGVRVAGINEERDLVEIVELADHPWFVAVQFHPEFKSKPDRAHPLFREFVKAAGKKKRESRRTACEASNAVN